MKTYLARHKRRFNFNKGNALIEASLAIVLLMGTAYMVCVQDTLALTQASYDANVSVATIFVSNEASRVRASFDPLTDPQASYIANYYPSVVGQSNTMPNVRLGGTNAYMAGRCPMTADVIRSYVSSIPIGSGITYATYKVSVGVPRIRGQVVDTNMVTRTISRVFRAQTGG